MAMLDRRAQGRLGWVEAANGRETDAFGGRFLARRSGGFDGVRLLEGRSPAYERTDGHFPAHVVTVNRGCAVPFEASFEGRRAVGASGSLHVNVWPAGMPHSMRWLAPGEWAVVELAPGLLDRVAVSVGFPRAPELRPSVGVADPVAAHLVSALALEIEEGGRAGGVVQESLAVALAGHLLHAHSAWAAGRRGSVDEACGAGRGRMAEVVRYIDERLDGDLSLGELAGVAGMEVFPFQRAFRRFIGEAPHRYVLRARVERAKLLLRDGALTISDVGLRTGFATPSHFSATFRRLTGRTPRAWRAAMN